MRRLAFLLLPCLLLPAPRPALADEAELTVPLDRLVSAAEASLQAGETQLAESHYRSALGEAWILMGTIEAAEGHLDKARDAFEQSTLSVADARRASQYLAMALLQTGDSMGAVRIMTQLATRNARDTGIRRLLAQALSLAGRESEAIQELEEARALVPDDLEVLYVLAGAYIRAKRVDDAQALFEELAKKRPVPQTWVLVGRTYLDAGDYARARAALRRAVDMDPKVRRAHLYLGMVTALEDLARVEAAVPELEQEAKLAPEDPVANFYLGLALVISRRYAEALPHLEIAARWTPPIASAYHILGRCLLELDRPAEAAAALARSLELAERSKADSETLRNVHYQLGVALRRAGRPEEAAPHFAAAEKLSGRLTQEARDDLDRYLKDAPSEPTAGGRQVLDTSAVSVLGDDERRALREHVRTVLARSYFNLGVMQAQADRFARAAESFERTVGVDPAFPRVQYSLGVALFNARAFDRAAGPLARALEETPADVNLRRMLAMAWLNTEAYEKAADLLESDPGRRGEPSLQYAYGLALARSERGAQAATVFQQLLEQHGDTAELHVLLGQAHAQQGDFASAIASFERALELDPKVPEANAALGVIYFRQGKLPEAEAALRRELAARPDDPLAQHTLAAVLEVQGQAEEALTLLRAVLKVKPDFADSRYLYGKILLAQGSALEAAEQLEAAARIAPEDANIHYQLARAYQRLGREDASREQFEIFQRLKDKNRKPVS
jgi:tetratricopeptide (TPR) repeat protein